MSVCGTRATAIAALTRRASRLALVTTGDVIFRDMTKTGVLLGGKTICISHVPGRLSQ